MSSESELGIILKEIFLENDHLSNYINNVGVGKISTNYGYHADWKYLFFATPQVKTDYVDSSTARDCIRIVSFRLADITSRYFINQIINQYDSTYGANIYSRKLYNEYYFGAKTARRSGVNVYKSLKLKGYNLNVKDIKKLTSQEYMTRSNRSIHDYIQEFYYVGDKNIVIGFVSTDSVLYLRNDILLKIITDKPTLKTILTNVLNCYKILDDRSDSFNIRYAESNLEETITSALMNQLTSGHIPVKANGSLDVKKLETTVTEKSKEVVKQIISGTIFGIKDTYSYTKALDAIINEYKARDKSVFTDGFGAGMKIGLKLEMLGWHLANPSFANSRSTDMWWEKEVEIIPTVFLYGQEKYEIPEKMRKYKIKKLYLNQAGQLRCDGNHPNVSSGNVCMGDLVIDFKDKTSDLSDTLARAETLLDHINYDSAYDSTDRQALLLASKKLDVFSKTGDVKKKPTTSIKKLAFLDDDGDEEEDEIIEEKPEPVKAVLVDTIVDLGEGISARVAPNQLGTPQTPPMPTFTIQSNNNTIESIFENNVPVHYTPNLDANQINSVTEDGVIAPLVFIASNGSNTHQSIATHTIREEFCLGDSNLL